MINLLYTRGNRSACLLGVRYYLSNYFAMYTRQTHSPIRIELAFAPTPYLGLGII